MTDTHTRINKESYQEFSDLCNRLNAKNITSEASKALEYFSNLNVLPSKYKSNYDKNIVNILNKIDEKIEKQNLSFIRYSDKSMDRQFAFLKEHEKQIFKKIALINENLSDEKFFKILLQNFFYVYELMFEIYQIQLGYYDFGKENDENFEDENEKIIFLIQKFQDKINAFVETFNEITNL